jgi:hypothetical protein
LRAITAASLGKLEVSSLIRRELEAVGNVQRFAPGVDICDRLW